MRKEKVVIILNIAEKERLQKILAEEQEATPPWDIRATKDINSILRKANAGTSAADKLVRGAPALLQHIVWYAIEEGFSPLRLSALYKITRKMNHSEESEKEILAFADRIWDKYKL